MSLSAAELGRLRDTHTAMLNSTCTIRRRTVTISSAGGVQETWNTVATVACRLMPERDRRLMEQVADREALANYYRLTLPYDADIRADDEVQTGGDTYQVVALWDDHSLRTARRAVVVKVA